MLSNWNVQKSIAMILDHDLHTYTEMLQQVSDYKEQTHAWASPVLWFFIELSLSLCILWVKVHLFHVFVIRHWLALSNIIVYSEEKIVYFEISKMGQSWAIDIFQKK